MFIYLCEYFIAFYRITHVPHNLGREQLDGKTFDHARVLTKPKKK